MSLHSDTIDMSLHSRHNTNMSEATCLYCVWVKRHVYIVSEWSDMSICWLIRILCLSGATCLYCVWVERHVYCVWAERHVLLNVKWAIIQLCHWENNLQHMRWLWYLLCTRPTNRVGFWVIFVFGGLLGEQGGVRKFFLWGGGGWGGAQIWGNIFINRWNQL
jgi:hypothetical protein